MKYDPFPAAKPVATSMPTCPRWVALLLLMVIAALCLILERRHSAWTKALEEAQARRVVIVNPPQSIPRGSCIEQWRACEQRKRSDRTK